MRLNLRKKARLGLLSLCLGCWIVSLTQARASSPGGHVYLSGEVHKEGAVEITSGETLTITQAIIANGGLAILPICGASLFFGRTRTEPRKLFTSIGIKSWAARSPEVIPRWSCLLIWRTMYPSWRATPSSCLNVRLIFSQAILN